MEMQFCVTTKRGKKGELRGSDSGLLVSMRGFAMRMMSRFLSARMWWTWFGMGDHGKKRCSPGYRIIASMQSSSSMS